MYVHEEVRLIYLANPRTASKATAQALKRVGFVMVGSHHSGLEELELAERVDARASYRIATTVRDLRTTLESWCRKLDVGMCHVLDKMEGTNQRGIVVGWPERPWTLFPHLRDASEILRFEHLQEDLDQLLNRHGLPTVVLEHID